MPPNIKISIRFHSRLLPILLVLMMILQLLDPYRGWVVLLVGLGSAWLISYAWARALARRLSLTREMRYGWVQVGDRLEERFTLINQSWLPGIWVEISDGSTLPGYKASLVTGIGGNGTNTWRSRGICTQRGLFTLGPTQIRTGDPFGFFSVQIDDPAKVNLMVLPPVIPLPFIDIAPGGQSAEGHRVTRALERTVSASTARPYLPGDSLRHIHWPLSARHDQLYVRQFDSTPSSDWWIFLDMNCQVQFGADEHSTEESSIILAASLADRGLHQRHAVGFVAYGQQPIWLPPLGGNQRRWEILRALAGLHPGKYPLVDVLQRARSAIHQRVSLIIITADTGGNWLEALLPYTWTGSQPVVLLLDPVSFGGQGDSHSLTSALIQCGIPHHLISRELFNRPEAHPGTAGRWEWRVSATGRAVPIRRPKDLDWRLLE
jgi:uncharacterized protein (DUF58 family)